MVFFLLYFTLLDHFQSKQTLSVVHDRDERRFYFDKKMKSKKLNEEKIKYLYCNTIFNAASTKLHRQPL